MTEEEPQTITNCYSRRRPRCVKTGIALAEKSPELIPSTQGGFSGVKGKLILTGSSSKIVRSDPNRKFGRMINEAGGSLTETF